MALRARGVTTSAAELIDAARAISSIDVLDRSLLRATLAAVLVKRREDVAPFDEAFARFFVSPKGAGTKRRRKRRGGGEPGAPTTTPRRGASSSVVRTVPPDEPRRPREGASHRPARPHRIERQQPGRGTPGARRARGRCLVVVSPHRRTERAERLGEKRRDAPRPAASRRDVTRKGFRERWTDEDARRLGEEIPRLLARIELRLARRKRKAKSGRLALHRIMRRNVGTGGVPFHLEHVRRARREPRLFLLLDVSHSVSRAAAALLAVTSGLAHHFRSVRVFFFVDRAVEVSDAFRRSRTRGAALDVDALRSESAGLNVYALSDYGRAFFDVLRAEGPALRRDTLLVVLGDARSNAFDPSVWVLEELSHRARRTIWLVPEPRSAWNTGDSVIGEYAEVSDVVCEAADLAGLEHAVRRFVS